MPVPVSQMWTVASYVLKQRFQGRRRYPLVLMLEPLFRCNLACAGCGKIQYPAHILKANLSPEECFRAVDECGAPMVSIPGGEPLMQARFAARLFAAAKGMGVHTAIETNGFYGGRLSDAELADIDLVILDMKGFSPEQHKRVTAGIDNSEVFEFARRLAALKRPMWLRYVLVPGLTDVDEEIAQVAAFGASLGVVERAEILPFHQMGRFKWEKLGLEYTLASTTPPSDDVVANALGIFRAAGLNAF